MTEVEDMAWAASGPFKDPVGLSANLIGFGEQRHRIQIALYGDLIPQVGPGLSKIYSPVQSDHIPTGLPYQRQQRCRIGSKVNDRHAGHKLCDGAFRVGQDELPIVVRAQTADPAIE